MTKWIHGAIRRIILSIGIGTPVSPTMEQIAGGIYDDLEDDDTPENLSKKGAAFEEYCRDILDSNGYVADISKASRDQGGDIFAEKDGISYVIQCKDTEKVGNKAVQEVLAALQFYEADYAAVVTDGSYTSSAKALAAKNDIALLKSRNLEDLDVFFK